MIEIDKLIQQALKSKNQDELRAYKNLKSEIQLLKTAKNAKLYDEAAEIKLISKMCKNLENDIKSFSEAHREDLVAEYSSELEVLKKLLPEPVNERDVRSEMFEWGADNNFLRREIKDNGVHVFDAIELENPFIPKKEMGNAIKYLKSKFPQADGKMISNIVKEYIV